MLGTVINYRKRKYRNPTLSTDVDRLLLGIWYGSIPKLFSIFSLPLYHWQILFCVLPHISHCTDTQGTFQILAVNGVRVDKHTHFWYLRRVHLLEICMFYFVSIGRVIYTNLELTFIYVCILYSSLVKCYIFLWTKFFYCLSLCGTEYFFF